MPVFAGEDFKVPVYQFLKEALTRKMGAKWYEKLEEIARDWENEKNA